MVQNNFEEEYAKYGPLDGEAACFCKKVESMSECPSRKGKDVDAQKHPIGFRWFHPNETSGEQTAPLLQAFNVQIMGLGGIPL